MIVLWAVNEQQKHLGEECEGKAKIHNAAGGRTVMDIEGKKTILKSQLTLFFCEIAYRWFFIQLQYFVTELKDDPFRINAYNCL